MQFRVEAGSLIRALSTLRSVTQSPRITTKDLTGQVLLTVQSDCLMLLVNNLVTQMLLKLPCVQGDSGVGCLNLNDLLRFAKGAKSGLITVVQLKDGVVQLSAGGSADSPDHLMATLPLSSEESLPRARSLPTDVMAAPVVVGELQEVLEQVTMNGVNTTSAYGNQVFIIPDRDRQSLIFRYWDPVRSLEAVLPLQEPSDGKYWHLLDGAAVKPFLAFLRAAPAHSGTFYTDARSLTFSLNEHGYVMGLVHRQLSTEPYTTSSRPPMISYARLDSVHLGEAVKLVSGGHSERRIWLRGSPSFVGVSLLAVDSPATVTLKSEVFLPFHLSMPAYILAELCAQHPESQLTLCGEQWRGSATWHAEPGACAFSCTVFPTEWGNADG